MFGTPGGARSSTDTRPLFASLRRHPFVTRSHAVGSFDDRVCETSACVKIAFEGEHVAKVESDVDERAKSMAELLSSGGVAA